MKVIHRGRGFGKTSELVKLAIEHDAYIVVPTMKDAQRIKERFPDVRMPLTWEEFVKGMRGAHPSARKVLIDDLDRCIESMSAVRVLGVSINDDDEVWQ